MVDPRYFAYDINLYPECCRRILAAQLKRYSVPTSIKEDPFFSLVSEEALDYMTAQLGLEIPTDISTLHIPNDENALPEITCEQSPSRTFLFGISGKVEYSQEPDQFYYIDFRGILVSSNGQLVAIPPSYSENYQAEIF